MHFGVAAVVTDDTLDPAAVARLVEQQGFESVFFGEHTHIPASRESPYPGGPLSPHYLRLYDPFVAATAAAAATTTLRVGTCAVLIAERDPIIFAKEVASLDLFSQGRLELIVGAGWNREAMRNHGTDPDKRIAIMRERMLAVREIWQKDESSFHGNHVDFDRIWSWPKPVQEGRTVPMTIAGMGPTVEKRVLEYADGWAPLCLEGIPERIAGLKREAAARGVDRRVTVITVPPDPAMIDRLAQAGADRCVLWIDQATAEDTPRLLDEWRAAADAFAGVA